jgi:hypothetical protein
MKKYYLTCCAETIPSVGTVHEGEHLELKQGTKAYLEKSNPILCDNEICLDVTEMKIKKGDGVTAWNDLSYTHTAVAEVYEITKFVII